ncbi:MAG: tRNA (adenosine(37)-N6)-dimethylallyltransferase MiaA [Coriobacteriaceae bacterium]|nr:tRNA (adenosine(37)-N6)-dimethylallyltransferase MiaA [Coriobacteriaceae bacterium]
MIVEPVIVISGPTASGKSGLADALAKHLCTDVLSCDSMQVYRGMDIGTAKTPVSERLVPLRLIDLVDPGEAYSAALYQKDARCEIERLRAHGKHAVLCGGTGLYVRAALDFMSFPHGETDGEERSRYNLLAQKLGPEGIHAYLQKRDPASASLIHPNNVRRVVRALEMLDEGVSYAEQSSGFKTPRELYPQLIFALTMDRDRLYDRINRRVDLMLDMGLLTEVKGLVESGFSDALTAMQAIGYKELIDYLNGRCSLGEAVDLIKQRSRRYAKRQLSWWRRDERTIWLDMDELSFESALELVLERLDGYERT